MVQLNLLVPGSPVAVVTVQRFPFSIGRDSGADLCVAQAGIWDRHLQIDLDRERNIALTVGSGALATVNGHPIVTAVLKNGDMIALGAAKIQFWLAPTVQSSFRAREISTWAALGALAAGEIVLIYWLLR